MEPKVIAQTLGTLIAGVAGVAVLLGVDIEISPGDIDQFVILVGGIITAVSTLFGLVSGWFKRSELSAASEGFDQAAANRAQKNLTHRPSGEAGMTTTELLLLVIAVCVVIATVVWLVA